MSDKPSIEELIESIGIVEKYLDDTSEKREAVIDYLRNNFYSEGFKRGLQIVVMGDEYPEDLKARVIRVLAILENQQNN